MGKRKEPAASVVEFFETASVETAQTVLAICKTILARRQPARTKTPRTVRPRGEDVAAPAEDRR